MATAALTIYPAPLAGSDPPSASTTARRLLNVAYTVAIAVVLATLVACVLMHGAELLKSSGVLPSTGAISGLSSLISNLMNSVKWYAATLVGLSACVIAAMFVSGHQSAHSHGMRVGFGIIALVCIPGLIA